MAFSFHDAAQEYYGNATTSSGDGPGSRRRTSRPAGCSAVVRYIRTERWRSVDGSPALPTGFTIDEGGFTIDTFAINGSAIDGCGAFAEWFRAERCFAITFTDSAASATAGAFAVNGGFGTNGSALDRFTANVPAFTVNGSFGGNGSTLH